MSKMDSGAKGSDHKTAPTPAVGSAPEAEANPYRAALRALRRPALIAAGFSALINILMLTGSLYMLQVYDRVLGSGSLATLQGLFLIVTLAYVFYGLYEFMRARVLSRAAMKLSSRVAPQTFRAWLRSGIEGDQAAGLPLRDLEILRGFIASPVMGTLFDLPWVPLYMVVLYAVHPLLGLVTLIGVGVVIAVALINRSMTKTSIDRGMQEEAASRDFADHGRRNAETITAMGMTDAVMRHWRQLQNANLATSQQASDVTEATSSFSKAFRMFLQSAMLTAGAWLVLGHEMSAGMIIASSVISGRLLAPIDQLIAQWKQIGRASVAHARLRKFFDEQANQPEPLGLGKPTGRITANNLMRFLPNTEPGRERRRQIDRVGFSLEPGSGLGIIGDSASGKSTLARLLVGAFTPDAGELRFDGATREQWGPELSRHIGYLPQSVVMLPGTVRDNIRRFMTDRSAKEVIEAAQLAGVHDMILRLPKGYDTMLGLPDQPLSGGQLQRICLARAIFGTPAIVVLDEPNSNLDSAGEAALRETIRALRTRGCTVIMMTHRMGILQEMDQVLMLRQGSVVKYGARDDVLISLGLAAPPAPPEAPAAAPSKNSRAVTFLRPKGQGGLAPQARSNAMSLVEALAAEPEAARADAPESTPGPAPEPAAAKPAVMAAMPDTTPEVTSAVAAEIAAEIAAERAAEAGVAQATGKTTEKTTEQITEKADPKPRAVFYHRPRQGSVALAQIQPVKSLVAAAANFAATEARSAKNEK